MDRPEAQAEEKSGTSNRETDSNKNLEHEDEGVRATRKKHSSWDNDDIGAFLTPSVMMVLVAQNNDAVVGKGHVLPSTVDGVDGDDIAFQESDRVTLMIASVSKDDDSDPVHYHEAMRRHNASDWKESIQRENDSVREARTFDVIDSLDVPGGRRLLTSRYVFKRKRRSATIL
jgi:hypothetical protein